MWTTANRLNYKRDNLRYPSDLTGEEWAHIEALIPPAKHGGRKRKVDVREVVNGIMYVLSTGCQWRYVPKDLPPKSTLYDYFDLWTYDGTLETIHHALYVRCREQIGREASPTAAIIDLAERGPNFLEQEIAERIRGGPLRWTMVVTVANPGDPTADPSKAWPEDRRTVEVGTLTVQQIQPERDGPCRDINFDPTVLPTGIRTSDDPFPAARVVLLREVI